MKVKKVLYLGTDPQEFIVKHPNVQVTHFPLIQIQPRSKDREDLKEAYADLHQYTHAIFTSKNAVFVCFEQIREQQLSWAVPSVIAVGQVTASHLRRLGIVNNLWVAEEETQEGIIALLKTQNLKTSYLFLPTAAHVRPALLNFLQQEGIRYRSCVLYDTVYRMPETPIRWDIFDEVFFTSPSTVKAFLFLFGQLPPLERCRGIGPITQQALQLERGVCIGDVCYD